MDHQRIAAFLERDPVVNILPLSKLGTSNEAIRSFLIAEARGRATARSVVGVCLVHAERMALPVTEDPRVASAFAVRLVHTGSELEHVLGERKAVTAFWSGYADREDDARLDRLQQFYVLDNAPTDVEPAPVRVALVEELEPVTVAAAAMYEEETLVAPLDTRPNVFRYILQRRLEEGRAYVWMDSQGQVLFKADVSTSTRHGVLLSGIYTRPDVRRRGFARRGLAAVCAHLLRRFPRIALYVNESNVPAIRLYESLGFTLHRPYRSIFVT